MPPKVVHLTSVHPPFDTRIYHKECATLAAAGYEVVLAATGADSQSKSGICVKLAPQAKRRFARMTITGRSVVQIALKEKAALYHFHDPELLPWAFLLQHRGHRVIFDMHENMRGALLTKPWLYPAVRPLISTLYSALERWLMADMPVIFAEESYARLYPWVRRTTTVLNLPRLDILRDIQVTKHSLFTAGYMGSVSALRGSQVTVAALALLKRQNIDVGLECVGPITATHQAELEAQARAASLNDVHFYGLLPPPEGWQKMAACHVGLAILQDAPNYVESYPTKMFEYMALGLPVIVSSFALYRNVVERAQCGFCVDPTVPNAIAHAIQQMMDDPVAAAQMGANGRRFVMEKMNWQTEARKLLDFYAMILGDSAS